MFKYLFSEENNIHNQEEHDENTESKLGLFRSKVCEKHKREAEYDSGEILINHIIRRRCSEFAVNLTE